MSVLPIPDGQPMANQTKGMRTLILDSSGQIAVVQNGIIENYRELSKSLKLKGIKLTSWKLTLR